MADFKFQDDDIIKEPATPPQPEKPEAEKTAAPSPPVPPAASTPPVASTPPAQAASKPSSSPPATPKPPPAPVVAKPQPPAPPPPKASSPAAPVKPAAPTPPTVQTPPATPVKPAAPQAKPAIPSAPRAPQPPSVPTSQGAPKPPQAPAAAQAKPASAARTQAAPSAPAAPQAPTAPTAPSTVSGPDGLPDVVGFKANLLRFLDKIDPYVEWVFRIAAVAALIALGFLLLAVFSGTITKLGDNPQAEAILRNLGLASQVLGWGLLVVAFCAILLMLDDRTIGVGIVVGGLVLHFAVPWLIKSQVVGASTSQLTSVAASSIIMPLKMAGFALIILGMLKAVVDVGLWFTELPARVKQRADVGVDKKAEPAQQRVAAKANMFSPCWNLPFCREVIRKQCPAFLAKKRCWKFGRGCYCDEEMVSRIVRGEALDVIKAPTRMSRQGKPPCGRCYIYLEHQSHKFRALSPLVLPLTVALLYFGWPYYEQIFTVVNSSLDSVWSMISFDPAKLTPDAISTDKKVSTDLSPEQVANVAKYLFGVIGGFFLLIYLSKLLEWVVFKAKL